MPIPSSATIANLGQIGYRLRIRTVAETALPHQTTMQPTQQRATLTLNQHYLARRRGQL